MTRARAIEDVSYGRDGWSAGTLFVSQPIGCDYVELTTPLQIIRLDVDQANELLDELSELRHKRVEAELRLAES